MVVTISLVNLFAYIFSYRTGLQNQELHTEVERDFLTGVGNRRRAIRIADRPDMRHRGPASDVEDADHREGDDEQSEQDETDDQGFRHLWLSRISNRAMFSSPGCRRLRQGVLSRRQRAPVSVGHRQGCCHQR